MGCSVFSDIEWTSLEWLLRLISGSGQFKEAHLLTHPEPDDIAVGNAEVGERLVGVGVARHNGCDGARLPHVPATGAAGLGGSEQCQRLQHGVSRGAGWAIKRQQHLPPQIEGDGEVPALLGNREQVVRRHGCRRSGQRRDGRPIERRVVGAGRVAGQAGAVELAGLPVVD